MTRLAFLLTLTLGLYLPPPTAKAGELDLDEDALLAQDAGELFTDDLVRGSMSVKETKKAKTKKSSQAAEVTAALRDLEDDFLDNVQDTKLMDDEDRLLDDDRNNKKNVQFLGDFEDLEDDLLDDLDD